MKATAARIGIIALLIGGAAPHAFAVNKDIVQLQEQVSQLQDSVSKLQQYNEERMGALTTLLQQTADSVGKMSATVEGLQHSMSQQTDAQGGKIDQISGQIQSLNDSVDELKARLDKIQKQMSDMQSQTESLSAAVQHPDAGGMAGPGGQWMQPQPGMSGGNSGVVGGPGGGKPSAAVPVDNSGGGAQPDAGQGANGAGPAANAPAAEQLYQTAFGDFMGAKYELASSEFGDVIHAYPDNMYSGSAHFYLGEIAYRQGHYAAAIKEYNVVINNFPGHNKIPGAELHKGFSLIASRQTVAGEKELRSLIQRYPNSPEATAAHNKLNSLR